MMQNLSNFQKHMWLPFENEIFQMMPNLAEILHVSLCTHLPPRKEVTLTLVNKWPRKSPNVPTASSVLGPFSFLIYQMNE